MSFKTVNVLAIAMALSLNLGCVARSQDAAPQLNYSTTWIGNSFGGKDKAKYSNAPWINHIGTHVQMDLDAIWVAPNGTVYCNAQIDEGGLWGAIYSRDGQYLDNAAMAGEKGGIAIAGDEHHVYLSRGVDGFRRFNRDGTNDEWQALPGAFVGGLAAGGGLIYASEPANNRIDVLDATTKATLRTFAAPKVFKMTLDQQGNLWAIAGGDAYETLTGDAGKDDAGKVLGGGVRAVRGSAPGGVPSRLLKLDPNGKQLAEIALAPQIVPVDIHLDARGRLMVADNGVDQNIKIYNLDGKVRLVGTFGTQGGIYSGVAGRVGEQRFNGLVGVSTDTTGNIIVAQNGMGPRVDAKGYNDVGLGTVLESYAPDGKRNWVRQGLLFVDAADVDPANENNIYSGQERFAMDWSKPAGQNATYAGATYNPFKYPDDPRLTRDNVNRGTPLMRRIGGKPFLFLTDMYSSYLAIYRFNPATAGEIAIPCAIFNRKGDANGVAPKGEWIWIDKNGDGQKQANEIDARDGKEAPTLWGWDVDAQGNVWQATEAEGIRSFPMLGLDKNGSPLYSYATMKTEPKPAPFTDLQRIQYDAANDVMYLGGHTADKPQTSWGVVGSVVARYDHWSQGNRTAKYQLATPYDFKDGTERRTLPKAMAVAGDYIFIAEVFKNNIHVYSAITGEKVGVLTPGPEVGSMGWVDVPYGVRAYKRTNGEYLVLVEDDHAAKTTIYRWKPGQTNP